MSLETLINVRVEYLSLTLAVCLSIICLSRGCFRLQIYCRLKIFSKRWMHFIQAVPSNLFSADSNCHCFRFITGLIMCVINFILMFIDDLMTSMNFAQTSELKSFASSIFVAHLHLGLCYHWGRIKKWIAAARKILSNGWMMERDAILDIKCSGSWVMKRCKIANDVTWFEVGVMPCNNMNDITA